MSDEPHGTTIAGRSLPVPFQMKFDAHLDDIDELGHVNNAVWVRWVQQITAAHWISAAPALHQERYVWVVLRHEIDYRGNLIAGGAAHGTTWVGQPRGARLDRFVTFMDGDGRTLVEAVTTWASIDRGSGRPARIPPAVLASFAMVDPRKHPNGALS